MCEKAVGKALIEKKKKQQAATALVGDELFAEAVKNKTTFWRGRYFQQGPTINEFYLHQRILIKKQVAILAKDRSLT